GRSSAIRCRWRRAASGCSPRATFAMARPSGSPPPSGRDRWLPRSSSTALLSSASRSELALVLARARQRTEALLEPLSDEQLTLQFSPLQSPLVWDLAHVGHFEELWLLRGGDPRSSLHDDVYDAFAHARSERGSLRLLSPDEARDYLRQVREAVA